MKSRSPEYILKARSKDGSINGKIGAGWLNPSGHISIVLDSLVVLEQKDNLQITLFPNDRAYDFVQAVADKETP
jgi:hypothetical protein